MLPNDHGDGHDEEHPDWTPPNDPHWFKKFRREVREGKGTYDVLIGACVCIYSFLSLEAMSEHFALGKPRRGAEGGGMEQPPPPPPKGYSERYDCRDSDTDSDNEENQAIYGQKQKPLTAELHLLSLMKNVQIDTPLPDLVGDSDDVFDDDESSSTASSSLLTCGRFHGGGGSGGIDADSDRETEKGLSY